jgi:c-di-GMP-related signal transduction protein
MIDLETILAEWKEDSQIAKHQLDETSRVTPALHSKYLEYLSLTKLRLKKAEFDQKTLLKDKYLYYEGKMSQEDIQSRGWKYDPYDGLSATTKNFKEYYYDSDAEIQESEMKIQYLQTIVETLTEIVSNLNWRHQTIGNMIRWRAFEAGS